MPYTQIKTGTRSPQGKDCVFLWLYCRDGLPYAKYQAPGAPAKMPMVLALLRWDGTFGTLGGKVDPGESLEAGLAREAQEEVQFCLAEGQVPEMLGTFQDGPWHIHSFSLELPYAELLRLRAQAACQPEASAEVAGICIVPAKDYAAQAHQPRGISAFLQNQFCATAKLELELLLARINLQK